MDNHINKRSEADALIWSEQQVALLRAGRFDQLDLESVIAELEYQVQSDKDEIVRRLRSLITSLLKYEFQPQQRKLRWTSAILEPRHAIERILKQMPSLRLQVDAYSPCYAPNNQDAASPDCRGTQAHAQLAAKARRIRHRSLSPCGKGCGRRNSLATVKISKGSALHNGSNL